MQKIQNHKASILSMLGMMGIAACIAFAIEPTLDTELNDIPGDTHLGEWVQAISSNQVSESVYATNGNLVVNGMEYPVGGGGGSEEEIVALSNRVNAIENAGYVATNEYGSLSLMTPKSTLEADNLNIHSYASIGITEGTLYVGAEGGASYLFVGGTNVMERIDEIASSGGDLTPATNYVDAVTNNLRTKADMVVYGEVRFWNWREDQSRESGRLVLVDGPGLDPDANSTWRSETASPTFGTITLEFTGGIAIWRLTNTSGMSTEVFDSYSATQLEFGDQPYWFILNATLGTGPTADRLATTGGVAVAIASAVPAGVLSTNTTGMVDKPVLGIYFAKELEASPQSVKIYQPEMDFLAINIVNWDDYLFTGQGWMYASDHAYDSYTVDSFPNLVMRYMDTTNLVPPMIATAVNAAISTNNPAFVAAVTNIIQNLPQDTLQALKAALNALP